MPNSRLHVRIITRLAFTLAIFTLVIASGILCATNVSAAPGDVDPSFTASVGANSTVNAVAIQTADGKVIIGGNFTMVNGAMRNRIARLNADGTLDTTFDPGTGANNTVRAIAVQSDSKIVIGGDFTQVNDVTRTNIARLNTDGTLDTTFDTSVGANNRVSTIAVQADGKVVIGGLFTTVNGVARNRIARLNADGTLDATFDPGTGANNTVRAIAVQSDSKIVIGGDFTTVNDVARNRIARLNTDGTLDTTFDTSVGADNSVFAVAVQPDGKVIIGGNFTMVNGVARNRIARLNTVGTLDTTFDPGTGTNSIVRAVAVQSDGKVVIGGDFTTVNDVARNRIARLNTDGTLDTTFDTSVGADSVVFAVAAQPDSKVVIGGQFTTVNNESRLGIARLQGTPGTTADDIFIEGFIRRSSGAPIGGVRVTLSGSVQDETTTDAAGHYRFSVPAGGVYQVSAAARGVRFSPSRLTFGSTVVNQVGDFTASSVKGRSNLRAR